MYIENYDELAEEYRKYIRQEMNNNELVNSLYDKYHGLIDKERIYLMYRTYRTTYINVKEADRLLECELDKEYRRRVFEEGTYRLIHIGGR